MCARTHTRARVLYFFDNSTAVHIANIIKEETSTRTNKATAYTLEYNNKTRHTHITQHANTPTNILQYNLLFFW